LVSTQTNLKLDISSVHGRQPKEPKSNEPKPPKPRKNKRKTEDDLEDIPIKLIKSTAGKIARPVGRPRKNPEKGAPVGVAKAAKGIPQGAAGIPGGMLTSQSGVGVVTVVEGGFSGATQGPIIEGPVTVAPATQSALLSSGTLPPGSGRTGHDPGLLQGQTNSVLTSGMVAAFAAGSAAAPRKSLQQVNLLGGHPQTGPLMPDSPPIAALAKKPPPSGLLPKPAKKKAGASENQTDGSRQFTTVHKGRDRGGLERGGGRGGGRGRGCGRGLGLGGLARDFDLNDNPPASPSDGTASPFAADISAGGKQDGSIQNRGSLFSGGVILGQKGGPLTAGVHSFRSVQGGVPQAEGRALPSPPEAVLFRGGDQPANRGSASQSIRLRLERSLDPRQEAQPLGARGGVALDSAGGVRVPPGSAQGAPFRGLVSPKAIPEHRKKSAVPLLDLNAEPKSPKVVKKKVPPALLSEDTPLQVAIDRASGKKSGETVRLPGLVLGAVARPSGDATQTAKSVSQHSGSGIGQGKPAEPVMAKAAAGPGGPVPGEGSGFGQGLQTGRIGQQGPLVFGGPVQGQRLGPTAAPQAAPVNTAHFRGPVERKSKELYSAPQAVSANTASFGGPVKRECDPVKERPQEHRAGVTGPASGGPVQRPGDRPPGYGVGGGPASRAPSGQQRAESGSDVRNQTGDFPHQGGGGPGERGGGLGPNPGSYNRVPKHKKHVGGGLGLDGNMTASHATALKGGLPFYQPPPPPPPLPAFQVPRASPPRMTSPYHPQEASPPKTTSYYHPPQASPPRMTSPYHPPHTSPQRLASQHSPPGQGPVSAGGARWSGVAAHNPPGYRALMEGDEDLPEFFAPEQHPTPAFQSFSNPGSRGPPLSSQTRDISLSGIQHSRSVQGSFSGPGVTPDEGLPPGFGRSENATQEPRDLDLPPGFGR
jgi:hypothetical protein